MSRQLQIKFNFLTKKLPKRINADMDGNQSFKIINLREKIHRNPIFILLNIFTFFNVNSYIIHHDFHYKLIITTTNNNKPAILLTQLFSI